MPAWTGGCLCGAVRYRVDADPLTGVACHCRDCQYVSGGAEADIVVMPRAAFTKLSGEETVYRSTAASGSAVWRSFCPVCGTPLFSGGESKPDLLFIRAGSFDDPAAFKRQIHIWTASAPPWHLMEPGLPAFPGNPPDQGS